MKKRKARTIVASAFLLFLRMTKKIELNKGIIENIIHWLKDSNGNHTTKRSNPFF